MEYESKDKPFLQKVEQKERRKIRAKKSSSISIWEHIGTFGLIGWSITFPALLGTGIGWLIDRKTTGSHHYTVSLLVLGLFIGCMQAWYWVSKEYRNIGEEKKDE